MSSSRTFIPNINVLNPNDDLSFIILSDFYLVIFKFDLSSKTRGRIAISAPLMKFITYESLFLLTITLILFLSLVNSTILMTL